jgi:acyl-coenzyme A synthetase/AMP-(fatty) acid ligase
MRGSKMVSPSALIDSRSRLALKLDPNLGTGNFLHHAVIANHGRDLPTIHSDIPFSTPNGEVRFTCSIAELKDISERYAVWYLERGVTRFDPVAVYLSHGIQNLIQYVALTSIGAVPVLTNAAMDPATAAGHFHRVGTVGVVTNREQYAALAALFGADQSAFLVCLDDIPDADPGRLPSWYPFRHDYDDPVMVTHSSGTTGEPKPVLLQHGRWFYGIRHLLGLAPAQGAERYLSCLPVSHNAAIAYAIHAILNGAALMVVSNREGEAVARAMEQFQPGTVVSFPQTYAELAEIDLDRYELGSVTTWINSGDAAHEAHIRRLVEYGYHYRGNQRIEGSQFVDGLGSSELGHSSFRIIHTLTTDTYDRCVGVPQSWVDAAVFDEHGEPASLGTVGRLGIRSPSLTTGYWNDSLTTYRSRVRGYWLTGDLVYQDSLGYFYHVDRISDMIRTKTGPLYSLQTEELILKNHTFLADCTVVGVQENDDCEDFQAPLVLAVSRTGTKADETVLLAEINHLQTVLGRPLVRQVLIVNRSEIPLGVTGKVLKGQLRQRLASNSWNKQPPYCQEKKG